MATMLGYLMTDASIRTGAASTIAQVRAAQ